MRTGGAEEDALRHHDGAAAAVFQVVQHVPEEQELRLRGPADLHVVDDPVLVEPPGEGRVGEDDVEAFRWEAQLRLRGPVEDAGQGIAAEYSHPVEAAQGEVHGGEADHLRVHVVAEERLLVELAYGVAAESIAEATADRLPFRLHLLDAIRRRVRKPDVVISPHQEAGRAGGRVVDGLAEAGVDELHHGPDDVAGRPELAELARLSDLTEHVLEEIALGVGVDPLEMEVVYLAHDLGEHRRLVDDEARARHEVRDPFRCDVRIERENFLADPGDKSLAVQCVRPGGPAEVVARDRLFAGCAGVPWIAERPCPIERTCVGFGSWTARGADAACVRALEHVEEEEEAELFGVLGRIGVATAEEVVADAVDPAAEFGGKRHR